MQKVIKKHHQPPNNLMPLPTRAERWHIVWQGPRLGFAAETRNFVATDALSTIFLGGGCALLSTFLIFSILILVCLQYLIRVKVRSNVNTTATTNNIICPQVRHTCRWGTPLALDRWWTPVSWPLRNAPFLTVEERPSLLTVEERPSLTSQRLHMHSYIHISYVTWYLYMPYILLHI